MFPFIYICGSKRFKLISLQTWFAVGSFVWTHLENLNKKHSPYQHLIRSIIAKSQLKNKFNTDARRFSRNYAGTTYFDSINVGSAVDANVVFSPESYLPRSLGLNLTVDVFGESVNLFDFGARLEGIYQFPMLLI